MTEAQLAPRGGALADYDYELPDGRIALRPAVPREAARLLVAASDVTLVDSSVAALADHLRPGDRLVVNDSRVIAARLIVERTREDARAARARVELTLLSEAAGIWRAFAKGAKRLAPNDRVLAGAVEGEVLSRQGPLVTLRFSGDPLSAGTMPLPPYIAARRAPDQRDEVDYQTVYADRPGSVAAPTAGLHLTRALIDALSQRGIGLTKVTLHVGPGTFLPVQADTIEGHLMHEEWASLAPVAAAEITATAASGGRIVTVGTTALRVLETAAAGGTLQPFEGPTSLFVRPGFRFRVVDMLLTNFHLPRSTLLMLVAAFVGYDRMRAIYAHALGSGYRFYSYGDASLLERAPR